jgi:ribonuclease P protein component
MLPKRYRLVKGKEYERVWKRGRSLFGETIGFKVFKNDLNIPRFGFVVGIKVSKKAVQRNRVRRQLSEIIRLKINSIKPGYDFIIIALPKILGKKYQEIDDTIEKNLKKMGFL